MNKTSNVIVNIVTEFKGLGNVKKAESAFSGLAGSLKSFAAAYTVERVLQSSINAFKEQQVVLAAYDNSLKNLGTSYADIQPVIDQTTQKFINLGFHDNQTIESLTKLTTALGNPAKALDVLSTTADLARYKNQSLAETSVLVGKAIAGNSRAFADLGLKIDKNLSPINAFNKLMEQAKAKAGGAAQAYANTFAGSLDIASAKAENASETLGKKLAPSLQKLAEFAVKYLIPVFTVVANNITPILIMAGAIGVMTAAVKALGVASAIAAGEMALNPIFAVGALAGASYIGIKGLISGLKTIPNAIKNFGMAAVGNPAGVSTTPQSKKTSDTAKLTAAEKYLAALEKQWNAQSLAAANATTKAAQAQLQAKKDAMALDKASLALQVGNKVFDLQGIELYAAAQQSIVYSDQVRIKLLQDMNSLQDAIASKNVALSTQLAATVTQDLIQVAKLQDGINGIKSPENPLASLLKDLLTAQQLMDELAKKSTAYYIGTTPVSVAQAEANAAVGSSQKSLDFSASPWLYGGQAANTTQPYSNITYNFNGTVLADQQLSNTLANNNASGIPSNLSRLGVTY